MARRLIAPAVALAVVLAAAACAEAAPPTLADGSAEAALPVAIWPDDPSLVTDVVCPGLDIELIAQSTTCTAVLDTDPITVAVEIDDDGAATAEIREALFVVAEAADQLARRLADDLGIAPPQVVCGRTVVVARAEVEVACAASRDADTIDFTVRMLDADGRWSLVVE